MSHEIFILHKGLEYVVVFGKCSEGYYFAMPSIGESGLISHPEEVNSNARKISNVLCDDSAGKAVAKEICAEWVRSKQ